MDTQIDHMAPGTSDAAKRENKKIREISLDGCRMLGRGLQGEVYRYDDELIIKVYNSSKSFADLEREAVLSRRAFVLGLPTAISFGIVSVGDRFGAMYELVDSDTLSDCISRNPSRLDYYAGMMAEMARKIHGTQAAAEDHFPEAKNRFRDYITHGIERSNREMAARCLQLIDEMPGTKHLIHGDFHTSNVFLQNSEALVIDMDRMAMGDPVFELGNFYLYYEAVGDKDPEETDSYLGIKYGVSRQFFRLFMRHYLQTEDEARIREVTDKAALLCNLRLINRHWKQGKPSKEEQEKVDRLLTGTAELLERVESLQIG